MTESARLIRSLLRDSGSAIPPDNQDDLFLLYALLLRVKGLAVTSSDVHDAWVVWVLMRESRHASVVPFEQLSPEVQGLDEPFRMAIYEAARLRNESDPDTACN